MELCAAKSLQSVMKAFRRGLSEAELACALRQTVRALAYVHAQRRIHRDIKSGNLLLQAVKNPVVIAAVLASVWNAVNDPTTAGLKDSQRAMAYEKPYRDGETQ